MDFVRGFQRGARLGSAGARAAGRPTGDLPRLGARRSWSHPRCKCGLRGPSFLAASLSPRPTFGSAAFPGCRECSMASERRSSRSSGEARQTREINAVEGLAFMVNFCRSALSTAWTESEIVWLFVLSGFVALVVRQGSSSPPKCRSGSTRLAHLRTPWSRCRLNTGDLVLVPPRPALCAWKWPGDRTHSSTAERSEIFSG